eukprot:gnl/Trimastix_PCT/4856.p1 GENE.gnl/Trimastix_PCT/4856~~gnl/Trimastix_PCT/4856.p1  ORF type:complete len:146 (-),score=12.61 gnl/Trimastix_PCT/4856:10-426(-)
MKSFVLLLALLLVVNAEEQVKKKGPEGILMCAAAITFGLYCVSLVCRKVRLLSPLKHQIIWNLILTTSFVPLAVTSLVLGTRHTLVSIGFPKSWMGMAWKLHLASGAVFVVLGFFHALWHHGYYTQSLKRLTRPAPRE